jgi:hypothetical protein
VVPPTFFIYDFIKAVHTSRDMFFQFSLRHPVNIPFLPYFESNHANVLVILLHENEAACTINCNWENELEQYV